MIFKPLPLPGAFVIEAEPIEDDRGYFARLIDREEFLKHGLVIDFDQASMSHNRLRNTLRGMHLQIEPFAEIKLVRVTSGRIFDVIIDLRTDSPNFLEHYSIELGADAPKCLYIPAGFAHGFQTLEANTEVYYQMNRPFNPSSARGFCWSDPQFGIRWPLENPILSPKDQVAPMFDPQFLLSPE